jgi:hypothetical protein
MRGAGSGLHLFLVKTGSAHPIAQEAIFQAAF